VKPHVVPPSAEPSPGFGELPLEYRRLLKLAEEKHHLAVTPLEQLKGGRTGALLYLASVSGHDPQHVEHFVVKFDRVNPRSKSTEGERHRQAVKEAPAAFAAQNMASLAHEIEHEGAIALFYTVAGQSLQHFRTLAAQESQSRLEALFTATTDHLLRRWNADAAVEQALHPRKLLQRWLGYRLKSDGEMGSFLRDVFHLAPDKEGFVIEGQVFPNPLSYGLDAARWGEARPVDVLVGFQHGDLNIGNILARFEEDSEVPAGYFLIDFALYKAQMPLLYDLCYLEMSYLVRELERASFPKWVSLVTLFSSRDIPNPRDVPVELAGACAVLNQGRKAFHRWVQESRPSLSDDLWGQLRLAAVAAGLNYCNKAALPTEERLAGLIYAAAHLKRYGERFGVPPPDDVGPLYDSSKWDRGAPARRIAAAPASRRTRLPSPPTPFIGREAEVKAVTDLLMREDVRLVSALGPGGTGKTRLALRVAADLMDRFDDGVVFVDLAPIREPEAVMGAVARAVGLRETSEGRLLDELRGHLQARRALLLLDNFEQVTPAAPGVGELLRDCSRLKLLVTSREALHIRDEHVFPVPPLGLPEPDVERPSLEQLARSEAVRLFVDRAQAVKPDFELTSENASTVAEICRRLDGLPLALELATARIGLFSPRALLERLGSRLKLLRGGARDLPARQQTLRDTIGWSHDLLDPEEQRLFAVVSVFRGGTLEAVEAVATGIESLKETGFDALEGLASLVDKSLIRREGTGGPRLLMLETIREYAAERLKEDTELDAAAHSAHAAYYADFTQRRWERLTGDGREAALAEIESDVENVRGAWRHWVAGRNLEQLRKLADGLWLLYDARGWYHALVESTGELLDVLGSAPEAPDRAEQEILLRISLARALMAAKGCTPEAEEAYTRAMELCEGQGEIPQLFPVLRGLASFYIYVADFEKGARMGEQILRLAERRDNLSMRVEGHLVLGYSLGFLSDLGLGLDHLEKAIALYDADQDRSRRFRMGSNPGVASLTTAALVLWMLGRPDRALERAEEALALAARLNHPFSLAYAHFHTALLRLWRREVEAVEERARTVLEVAAKHEFLIWRAVATCLHGAALVGMGRAEAGLAESSQGMELYRGLKTPPVFWPLLLFTQAGALGEAGRPADGLARLDEAIEVVGQESEGPFASQLCRLKGELLLRLSPESPAEAEPWLQRALEIARRREARTLELQAAMALARLWRGQGRPDQGRGLLGDVYGSFTEGLATADLEDARVLLADLS
jgi:predicted ATPase